MERSQLEKSLAERMAELTQTRAEDWYLTYRARHGMLTVFCSLVGKKGAGEVVTQLLTCCTAVDPIIAAGLVPVYGELSAQTCSLDPDQLRLGQNARAVVLQHTYGIVDDASSRALVERAHEAGAVVVEDCAHCVARMARDEAGVPVADVSVHSFGVEKMLPTLFGGAVWVNPDSPLAGELAHIRESLAALPAPPAKAERLNSSYRQVNRVLVHLPLPLARPLRRALAKGGLFDPAVSDEERLGGVSHEPTRPTTFACDAALAVLSDYEKNLAARSAAVCAYREALAGAPGVEIPAAVLTGEVQPLVRMPILLANTEVADAVESAVLKAGYYTTAWYRPELGPGVLDEAAYRVPADRSALAQSDRLVACVANLPTDIPVDGVRKVIDAVRAVASH